MCEYIVYMHISPSGKKYIGITKQNPKRRWNSGNGYKNNDYFTKAIKKYGWNNFLHIILAENLTEAFKVMYEVVEPGAFVLIENDLPELFAE